MHIKRLKAISARRMTFDPIEMYEAIAAKAQNLRKMSDVSPNSAALWMGSVILVIKSLTLSAATNAVVVVWTLLDKHTASKTRRFPAVPTTAMIMYRSAAITFPGPGTQIVSSTSSVRLLPWFEKQ